MGQAFTDATQNIGNGFNTAWQQVNQFGQNVGQSFGQFFQPPTNQRFSRVMPLGDLKDEGASQGANPLTREAQWFKDYVNDKTRSGDNEKIPAEFDAPFTYSY